MTEADDMRIAQDPTTNRWTLAQMTNGFVHRDGGGKTLHKVSRAVKEAAMRNPNLSMEHLRDLLKNTSNWQAWFNPGVSLLLLQEPSIECLKIAYSALATTCMSFDPDTVEFVRKCLVERSQYVWTRTESHRRPLAARMAELFSFSLDESSATGSAR